MAKKFVLRIDGKTFSPQRLANALVTQELEEEFSAKLFIKELKDEVARIQRENDESRDEAGLI